MLSIERRNLIEKHLNEEGSIIISEISKVLEVSEETIRRDLHKMEQEGLLNRVRGGAYKNGTNGSAGTKIAFRKKIYIEEKKAIANKCSKLIDEGDIIMLGSSTTEIYIAEKLSESNEDVTVITNSLEVVNALNDSENVKIICIGGNLERNTESFVGIGAIQQLDDMFAHKAFISCSGIDMKFGVTSNSEAEAEIRKKMVQNSSKTYLVADITKFDRIGAHAICGLDEFEGIVTEKQVTGKWGERLEALNIRTDFN